MTNRELEMMSHPFDVTVPSVSRMYDYALGGKDNFAADRAAFEEIIRQSPDATQRAADNRRFLQRAVRYAADHGVAQFIDIGCGLPTAENTHQIARAADKAARVVYVDNDPLTMVHARALLATDPQTIAVEGDLREPAAILGNPAVKPFLNLDRPIAVVLVAVAHFLEDPLAHEVVDYLKSVMAPGSYLVISHATADDATGDEVATVQATYRRARSPIFLRTLSEVERFFDGMELAEPGVTAVTRWQNPGYRDTRTIGYGGVARKQ
jgi:O-methyltransferase involved in polyketide biosynthesis